MYFKIGDKDFSHLVSQMKVGHETLVSDKSGRNAKGEMFIDLVSKKFKIYITFRYMSDTEMNEVLQAIDNYIINITFLNPIDKKMKTIKCYTGTPEPDAYTIQDTRILYKPMSLNFIEL